MYCVKIISCTKGGVIRVCHLCGSSASGTSVQEGSLFYKQDLRNKLYTNFYCYSCLENPANKSKIFYDEHPEFSDEEIYMDWSDTDEAYFLGD